MDILHTETEVLTVKRTVLKTASDDVIHVLEYMNEDGKVIDSIMRTKHGYELDDLELTDQIWEFLDAHYAQEDNGPEYDSAGFTHADRVVDGQYMTTNNFPAENAENTNLENV
jgi:hypothetical protein